MLHLSCRTDWEDVISASGNGFGQIWTYVKVVWRKNGMRGKVSVFVSILMRDALYSHKVLLWSVRSSLCPCSVHCVGGLYSRQWICRNTVDPWDSSLRVQRSERTSAAVAIVSLAAVFRLCCGHTPATPSAKTPLKQCIFSHVALRFDLMRGGCESILHRYWVHLLQRHSMQTFAHHRAEDDVLKCWKACLRFINRSSF